MRSLRIPEFHSGSINGEGSLQHREEEALLGKGFRLCDDCGALNCGRKIARDGSVWPLRDTGFRMKAFRERIRWAHTKKV